VGGGEVVDVEPDVLGPAVGDQVLISSPVSDWECGAKIGRVVVLSTLSLPT
jgi:hypothetical protein